MKTVIGYSGLALILVATLFLGCDSNDPDADVDSQADEAALLEADKSFSAAAAAGDIQKVMSVWTDDAINYFPGAPPAIGKAAIGELIQNNRSIPGFSLSWEPKTSRVPTGGELGYTSGTFRLTVGDPEGNLVTKNGHYVSIWVRQADGSWKVALEMSTFGPPTP